ncbi:hypothetical protein BX265_4729 [Streptomyces sp. TLI_235]|nr:hypothetical protein [Streptomyces sp. TLI_235]PBC79900.1 hypothetical protein BX265_4729 [Streptomyces sp. TLI_235]
MTRRTTTEAPATTAGALGPSRPVGAWPVPKAPMNPLELARIIAQRDRADFRLIIAATRRILSTQPNARTRRAALRRIVRALETLTGDLDLAAQSAKKPRTP